MSKDKDSEEIRAVNPRPSPEEGEGCLLLAPSPCLGSLSAFKSTGLIKAQDATR